MEWEIWVCAADTCNQMILEGADGPFCCIASVDARWDELVMNAFFVEEVFQKC
jgi:hypothetical protein